MDDFLRFCIPAIAIMFGVQMIVWPGWTIGAGGELMRNSTPARARREVRVAGVILILLGAALLYSILTHLGQPVDAIGF